MADLVSFRLQVSKRLVKLLENDTKKDDEMKL